MMEEESIKKERSRLMQALAKTTDQKEREKLMAEDEALRNRLANMYASRSPQVLNAQAEAKRRMEEINHMQAVGKQAYQAEQLRRQRWEQEQGRGQRKR